MRFSYRPLLWAILIGNGGYVFVLVRDVDDRKSGINHPDL